MNIVMTLTNRINCLQQLRTRLSNDSQDLQIAKRQAEINNPWFTQSNISAALDAIGNEFLSDQALNAIVSNYHLDDLGTRRNVGLVLAGNIPLVGWHDVMCTYLVGHTAQIKYSDKDKSLMSWMISQLVDIDPKNALYFEIVHKLAGYDAAIATGSNNTATHFEYYFKNVPSIIRRSRNSIGLLLGTETDDQLTNLGKDVFTYFGLGCRNVSMLMIPNDFEVSRLFEVWENNTELKMHNKYMNNYDYNIALFLLNKEIFLHNDYFILKESEKIISRIATLHIYRYPNLVEAKTWIENHSNEIQCVVSTEPIDDIDFVPFGESQNPSIMTYSDGVDTIQFLMSI
jgi:hypothetical protein